MTLTPRRVARAVLAATLASAVTGTGAAPASAATVTVRVLPATAAFSVPIGIVGPGAVVGNEGDTGSAGDFTAGVGTGTRPWVSLAGVTLPLGRGGAPYAAATATAGVGIVAGQVADVAQPDAATPTRAVRWLGPWPRELSTGDVAGTAFAANRAGDVLVGRPLGTRLFLVGAGGASTEVTTGAATFKFGHGVNTRREVLLAEATGGSFSTGNLTVWRDGVATRLPGESLGFAGLRLCGDGITESGYVVRSFVDLTPRRYRVVLRGRDDVDVPLTDPATTDAEVTCGASGRQVNEAGHVVGVVRTRDAGTGTQVTHATLWRDGGAVDLGVLPGDLSSRPLAINDRDEVIVQSVAPGGALRTFLWRDGAATELPTPAGHQRSVATDLDDRGHVVGFAVRTADGTAAGTPAGIRTVTWRVTS